MPRGLAPTCPRVWGPTNPPSSTHIPRIWGPAHPHLPLMYPRVWGPAHPAPTYPGVWGPAHRVQHPPDTPPPPVSSTHPPCPPAPRTLGTSTKHPVLQPPTDPGAAEVSGLVLGHGTPPAAPMGAGSPNGAAAIGGQAPAGRTWHLLGTGCVSETHGEAAKVSVRPALRNTHRRHPARKTPPASEQTGRKTEKQKKTKKITNKPDPPRAAEGPRGTGEGARGR